MACSGIRGAVVAINMVVLTDLRPGLHGSASDRRVGGHFPRIGVGNGAGVHTWINPHADPNGANRNLWGGGCYKHDGPNGPEDVVRQK